MPYTTKIFDSNNQIVKFQLNETNYKIFDEYRNEVHLYINGQKAGFMKYSIQENCLYIHRMDNFTTHDSKFGKYKYVGSALFEHAFRKSIDAGKGGRIELDSIDASAAAYFRMGFRRKSNGAIFLNDLIIKYFATKDWVKKTAIKKEISAHSFFQSLSEDAAKNLKKKSDEKVSFNEAITYGIYSPFNDEFAVKLRDSKTRLSGNDCYFSNMQGIMYLPDEIIEKKRLEFFVSQTNESDRKKSADTKETDQPKKEFIPIGSNYFWSQATAKKQVKNLKLQALIDQGKLNSSNAVEIDAKTQPSDPILNYLLSDIGLEMMNRNLVSGWYACVYFTEESAKAVFSENGLKAFEKGYVKNVTQLINFGCPRLPILLSDKALEKFESGEIKLSESGHSILNSDGKALNLEKFLDLINDRQQPAFRP